MHENIILLQNANSKLVHNQWKVPFIVFTNISTIIPNVKINLINIQGI